MVETDLINEKKRFYELFDSFSSFLSDNFKEFPPKGEKIYAEATKLVNDLQILQDLQKIDYKNLPNKISSPSNSDTPKSIKQKTTISEKPDVKAKKTPIHHHHTNSLDNDRKLNLYKTPPNSVFSPPSISKDPKKNENFSLKHNFQPKTNGNSNFLVLDNQKNTSKLQLSHEIPLPSRSHSKELDRNLKLPQISSPIKLKKAEEDSERKKTEYSFNKESRSAKSKSVYSGKKEINKVLNKNFALGYMDLNSQKMQILSKLKKKEGG